MTIENANRYQDKMRAGQVCLGVSISYTDPAVSEALCGNDFDYLWIDTEHNPLSLETLQAHVMATKGSDKPTLVRVRPNDPDLIKPILDLGDDGTIVSLIKIRAE